MENRIAVYSPHTSFDSVKGGVNDWLASAFEGGKFQIKLLMKIMLQSMILRLSVLESSKPIEENARNPDYGYGRICTLKSKISIEDAIQRVKEHTGLKHVRLARACRTGINSNIYF